MISYDIRKYQRISDEGKQSRSENIREYQRISDEKNQSRSENIREYQGLQNGISKGVSCFPVVSSFCHA